MKRLLAIFFVIGAICFGTWSAERAVTFAEGGGGDAAALQADTALQLALKKKDAKAVGVLLDQSFTWTNEAGQTLTSAQFLRDAAAGTAVGDTEYNDVKARDYGQLAVVTGIGKRTGHAGTFFARIWVKRPAGWLLLTHQDTAILTKGSPTQQGAAAGKAPAVASDCENPCRSLPYYAENSGTKRSRQGLSGRRDSGHIPRREDLGLPRRRRVCRNRPAIHGIARHKSWTRGANWNHHQSRRFAEDALGRVVRLRRCGHHYCRPPAGWRTALSRHSRVGESRRPLATLSQAGDHHQGNTAGQR